MSLRRIAALIGILIVGSAGSAAAQADIIRGQILGPDSLPVEGATVTATSMDDQTSRVSRTGKDGRYTIVFNPGSGDYLMTASAIGFQPATPRQVRRETDEFTLVFNARFTRLPVQLDAVTTTGSRQQIDRDLDGNDERRQAGIGSDSRDINLSDLGMGAMGDIAAMAASLPGVTYIPGVDGGPAGFSILGLGADENMTTINGLSFDGGDLPADAVQGGRVSSNAFNPAQGGFSGAQVSLRVQTGNNFVRQSISTNFDPKTLQFTDAAGQQLGQQFNRTRIGINRSGPIRYNRSYYYSSLQFTRQTNNLQTLLNTDALGLQRLGVAADSVTRLMGLLDAQGIPVFVDGLPDNRTTESLSSALNFSFNPTGTQNYTVTFTGGFNRQLASNLSGTAIPTTGGESRRFNGGVSGRTSWYIGAGFLNDAAVGLSYSNSNSSPYVELPNASIRVRSIFDDGTPSAITNFRIGGNSGLPTQQTDFTVQGNDAISWFSIDNKHQFQVTLAGQYNRYTQDNASNRLGTVTYNSLEDFQASQPSRFTRTLQPAVRSGSSAMSGFSVSDAYRPTQRFQIQYGFRGDLARFNRTPRFNPEVEELFGIRNDHVPTAMYLSPRFGFSWTYGTAAQISAFQGAARGSRGTITGGVGAFQNMMRANSLDQAVQNTGLPTAIQSINCVGDAVPTIDWSAMTDHSLIPDACADGTMGNVFASTSPSVTLFDNGYAPPRSYRGTLNWNTTILNNRFRFSSGLTYSHNVNQASTVDLNFDNSTVRFNLADEGGRPVFAAADRIVTGTGQIASSASRKHEEFTRVSSLQSDLHSRSQQARFSITPARFQSSSGFRWTNFAYTWQRVDALSRGFGGNTAGDPWDTEWSRASGDWRHQFRINLSYTWLNTLSLSLTPSLQSGTPFTPMVDRDINGDGSANDRAFIYNPANTADPVLASQMQSLLDNASPAARKCLTKQLGAIAGRNSCEGPWRFNMGAQIRLENQGLRIPQRARVTLGVSNPLTGVDALVNGWNNLKGWGANPSLETSLLSVEGFDPTTQRFAYRVNERFGETRANRTTRVAPFQLSLGISYDLGRERERQQLNLWLRQGRADPGQKRNENQWRTTYSNQIRNPFQQLLQQADTLKLTDDQADSIAMLNRNFSRFQDSVWAPVAQYLANLPNEYDEREAWGRVMEGWNQALDRLAILGPTAKSLLTKDQLNLLPPFIAMYLDETSIRALKPGNSAGRARMGGG